MKEIIIKLATQANEVRYPAYGIFHLSFLIVGTLLAVFLAVILRTKNETKIKVVFLSAGILLLSTEIVKQLIFTITNGNQYNWTYFPFQLCSLPLYFCFIIAFIKFKYSKYIFMITQTYTFLGGVFTMAYPPGVLTYNTYISTHSMVWHIVLMFLGLYVCTCGIGIKSYKDFFKTVFLFLFLSIFAVILNLIVEGLVNYEVNYFMINPLHISTMPILDVIQAKVGWFLAFVCYVAVFSFTAFCVFWSERLINKSINKRKTPEIASNKID